MNIKRIRNDYGDYICRKCINWKYHAHLEPKHCRYGYTTTCRCCGKIQNIVVGLTFLGKIKLFFKL